MVVFPAVILPLLILTGLLFGQDIKYDPDIGEPIDVENIESSTFDLNTLPKDFVSKQEIVNMSEEEKGFLYGKYIINHYSNMFINLLIPTYGYYRINQWNRGLKIAAAGLSLGALIDFYEFLEYGPSYGRFSEERFERKMNIMWSMFFVDLYIQTKKYL